MKFLNKTSLFFRTFLLLTLLTTVASWVWFDATRTVEKRSRLFSEQRTISSLQQFLSAILTELPAEERSVIINHLNQNERIDFIPVSATDEFTPLPLDAFSIPVSNTQHLTIIELNSIPGIWQKTLYEDTYYWLGFPQKLEEEVRFLEWISWASSAILLCLFGATIIVGFVHLPLHQIAIAAKYLARGKKIDFLDEEGPEEVQAVKSSFNRLMRELENAESERNLMLTGVSHDLRTPLARLRLELEFASISEESRLGMEQDIYQLERTISQFVEYTRPRTLPDIPINISYQLKNIVEREEAILHPHPIDIQTDIATGIYGLLNPIDLERIINNLFENARKYALIPDQRLVIHITLWEENGNTYLRVDDNGPGILESEQELMLQPFVRGSSARTGAQGSGLGLSIINKLLSLYGGRITLGKSVMGGLSCLIEWPNQ